jgi:hypothetical protein
MWDEADSGEDLEDIEETPPTCPFCRCGSFDCKHYLGVIDRTFRTVSGSLLKAAYDPPEVEYDDTDFIEYFDRFCEACDASAYALDYDFEGGPGMSSAEMLCWSDKPEQFVEEITKYLKNRS